MLRIATLIVFALLATGCASKAPATVKGAFVFDGKPFPIPPEAREVFVVFHALAPDGNIDQFQMYTAQVQPDGTFEVVNSDGKLPVGTYQWSITATKGAEQFKPFALDKTKSRIDFKPGSNTVSLELKTN